MEDGSKAGRRRQVVFKFEIGLETNDDDVMFLVRLMGFGGEWMGLVFARESCVTFWSTGSNACNRVGKEDTYVYIREQVWA
jgi:hypothetical protein